MEERALRQHWNRILAAEGLGEIDFRLGVTSSSADHHQRLTNTEAAHRRDPDAVDVVREVLNEYRISTKHRRVLHGHISGQDVREIARTVGVSKDTAHRILLRHLGNHDAVTMCEIDRIKRRVTIDARRTHTPKASHPTQRPVSASESVAAYYEAALQFSEQHSFKWARDQEIWERHVCGESQRRIAQSINESKRTVENAIDRVRKQFAVWLKARERNESDHAHISAMFETLTNHEARK